MSGVFSELIAEKSNASDNPTDWDNRKLISNNVFANFQKTLASANETEKLQTAIVGVLANITWRLASNLDPAR